MVSLENSGGFTTDLEARVVKISESLNLTKGSGRDKMTSRFKFRPLSR